MTQNNPHTSKPLSFLMKEKGLFVFDMDSTLVDGEGIDELARSRGVFDQVVEITERAMRGEMDFAESLDSRVKLLKGATLSDIDEAYARMPLMPGALDLIGELKRMGHKVAIVSGGFDLLAERYERDLGGVDALIVNELEFVDGVCTGRVIPPVVTAKGKAEGLTLIAGELDIPLSHTVAIGDGANDIEMLGVAGFGIAFCGKPKLIAAAKASITEKNLLKVLEFIR